MLGRVFARFARPASCAALAVFLEGWPVAAWAYRPFDGTDADVAEEGAFELELGPVGYLHQAPYDALVAPALIFNQGVGADTELVLTTNRLQLLGTSLAGQRRVAYVSTGFFTKHVWRAGALQGASGPSLATEVGPLFPTGPDEHRVGGIATTIVTVVTPAAALHFNFAPSLNPEGHFDIFASTIVEAPHAWALRPVMELYVERTFGVATTFSGLLGAIWRVREGLDFDTAVRVARAETADSSWVIEGRLGLTWVLQVWRQ